MGAPAPACTVMTVVAFVPDLMDRSKVAAVEPSTVFVGHIADLGEQAADHHARLVVVDLGRAGALDAVAALAATGVATIGFASHVDAATHEAARAAGCGQVLARSVFFRRLPELLA